ncbi:E3 ubiquitin/ISG15 ligase TRIM25-like [Cyprinus carpio]|uniref:E3 ubiquitin/ISG15 ligase TRIM25-like n=1 Tax=Cyprinus carpio TaxID=7962 RepID=A0A9Q9XQL8_CYPCA|nr:E3 ubiquitin/ISG15 ligase TRIM25-like [Cyprinus carpio]
MAEASISVDQDQLSCSVCLDLMKDPVTISCGHTFCMRCISGCWDEEDWKRIYSCPQCRQTFSPRPDLCKYVAFAKTVEKLKKTRLQAAGSGDVQCDSCSEIKQRAVKSCLECRICFCQINLEQHENLFRGQKHNLMDTTERLQELIWPQHDELLDMYCCTDQSCICMMCLVEEHNNHVTVSAAAARTEKQRHLEKKQREIIQQKEKELQELRTAVASHKRSAQTAVEDSERVFTQLICSVEKCHSEVKQLIRDQERAVMNQAEEQLERLKEMIELSETPDHVHFLQSVPSVFQCLSGSTEGFTVSSHQTFDAVVNLVSQLRDNLQFCKEESEEITKPDKQNLSHKSV